MQSVIRKLLLAWPNSFRRFARKAEGLSYVLQQPGIGMAGTGMLPSETAASVGATLHVSGRSLQSMSCGELTASAFATSWRKLAAVACAADSGGLR